MRVFMLGWEFPPFISGGLGTACYGLTKAMSGIGTDNPLKQQLFIPFYSLYRSKLRDSTTSL